MRPFFQATRVSLALAVLAIAPPHSARACLNYYGTDVHGHKKEAPPGMPGSADEYMQELMRDGPSREELLKKKEELEGDVAAGFGYKAESDLAATLIYLAEYRRAIAILQPLAEQHPDEYTLAANLGTAYELAGDNHKALKWIKEGVRRNAQAHEGSEWLHVKILEAKIELEKNPDWLKDRSVSGVDFGDEATPEPIAAYERIALTDLRRAIGYQLRERMGFVKPPDAIVGDLLFDLASVIALRETVEFAVPVYELAVTYEAPRAALAQKRIDHFRSFSDFGLREQSPGFFGWFVCAGVLVLIALPFALFFRALYSATEPRRYRDDPTRFTA